MEILSVKKTGSHSEYLYALEKYGSLIEFQSLTKDALLFLESADTEMAKIKDEISRRGSQDTTLRDKED